ncbi:unnamed protein product, partial [Ectocarpus sp. 8 AP-2014]
MSRLQAGSSEQEQSSRHGQPRPSSAAADDAGKAAGSTRGRRSSFQDRLSSSDGGAGSKVATMRGVFEKLLEVSQDEEIPDGLAETAEDLVSASVMNHPDSDYRLLVACCLVEVLRIFAPDAPYTDDQVLATLSLIITQLRGLG